MINNGCKMFIAGTMLGAMGMLVGQSVISDSGNKTMKKAKSKAASMAGKMSRDAGEMLTIVGESLAHRIR